MKHISTIINVVLPAIWNSLISLLLWDLAEEHGLAADTGLGSEQGVLFAGFLQQQQQGSFDFCYLFEIASNQHIQVAVEARGGAWVPFVLCPPAFLKLEAS